MSLIRLDALKFTGSENLCTSLRILAEGGRTAEVRFEKAEHEETQVREYLTITVSRQLVTSTGAPASRQSSREEQE